MINKEVKSALEACKGIKSGMTLMLVLGCVEFQKIVLVH